LRRHQAGEPGAGEYLVAANDDEEAAETYGNPECPSLCAPQSGSSQQQNHDWLLTKAIPRSFPVGRRTENLPVTASGRRRNPM